MEVFFQYKTAIKIIELLALFNGSGRHSAVKLKSLLIRGYLESLFSHKISYDLIEHYHNQRSVLSAIETPSDWLLIVKEKSTEVAALIDNQQK
jgi:hypothetical protein